MEKMPGRFWWRGTVATWSWRGRNQALQLTNRFIVAASIVISARTVIMIYDICIVLVKVRNVVTSSIYSCEFRFHKKNKQLVLRALQRGNMVVNNHLLNKTLISGGWEWKDSHLMFFGRFWVFQRQHFGCPTNLSRRWVRGSDQYIAPEEYSGESSPQSDLSGSEYRSRMGSWAVTWRKTWNYHEATHRAHN